MPSFPFVQALTASQVDFRPLAGWQYRRVPFDAYVRLYINTTGASNTVRNTIYSGSDTVVQRSPVAAGGTAGVLPVFNNTPLLDWIAHAGDELIISIDETAGATPTVNGIVYVDPL